MDTTPDLISAASTLRTRKSHVSGLQKGPDVILYQAISKTADCVRVACDKSTKVSYNIRGPLVDDKADGKMLSPDSIFAFCYRVIAILV